ncbi:aromatic amino acid transport protein [Pectobacterium atrosepticum SCRI1043]|uniref:Aromatic amino acid transport protein AroP n=1 Tax=Pectobacterium atrosepticum (strain SCRI 1043 / ATCC BAA-672) TaxID=218491 RepID=Q6D0K7_PECAS|nr:amino acid permease [Pectobacterium atrosepticum]GKV86879.1 aromatic amino acid transporter AroP [Pectobacterium carotovorum subsp. carotovorum]AIA72527.1 aromatic amino acid transporter [Pectobacterium atrosepticum]AIK15507.1 aromatic amino acid transport protein [Pectobacterium atrosepticum]ATY92253.1 aromatic amino acid transporter AroP [Pectobacterium atrosepticum]KFX14464.1 aromatic amino acid transporter [Pectobacterium atrosepticum]
MDNQQTDGTLKRGLKNRHIQLIALGGAVGTGLFLGIAQTIKMAGPSVLLGYAIGGLIAFLIMRQLGEMVVEEPVAGSFSHFAYKYWGDFAGFASGWNYWVLYVLVAMAELSAVGIYVQYWWPDIPTWVSAAVFFLLINAINLANVKVYGEMEFWFAIIKVAAIIGMIAFGGWLLISGTGGPEATVTNLWAQGGFFPNGGLGLVMAMAVIMFSFGGLELVGITAAEADDPEKSIPRATNQVIYRILIFYIGSLAILLSLYPWGKVVEGGSPFVMIFHELNSNVVATILNVVVLTAALSVYNSCVYCNSRMLFGLAKQGNGPKVLETIDSRGVPVVAIGISALATALCVLINYLIPGKAFELLMALVVSALVINWAMISLAHLKFRAQKDKEGTVTKFKALLYPLGNYICLLFLAGILVIMFLTPGIQISVMLIPVWLIILGVGYFIKKKNQAK